MINRLQKWWDKYREYLMIRSVIAALGIGGLGFGLFGSFYITIPAWVLALVGYAARKQYQESS